MSHGVRIPDELVREMHGKYIAGQSLNAVARAHGYRGRSGGTAVRHLFVSRGLPVRNRIKNALRDPVTGRLLPIHRHSAEEVDAMIAAATRVAVPKALCQEWRLWSTERRGDFIRRIRARLQSPADRPATPFSSNVEPWEYWSENVRAIVKRLNAGRSSRNKVTALKPCSQGVIWRGTIFFWTSNLPESEGGFYQTAGPEGRVNQRSRRLLHHLIWEEAHGRKVPAGHVLRFRDGNYNNLTAENMVLVTRNAVARENQGASLRSGVFQASLRRRWARSHVANTRTEREELQALLGKA